MSLWLQMTGLEMALRMLDMVKKRPMSLPLSLDFGQSVPRYLVACIFGHFPSLSIL